MSRRTIEIDGWIFAPTEVTAVGPIEANDPFLKPLFRVRIGLTEFVIRQDKNDSGMTEASEARRKDYWNEFVAKRQQIIDAAFKQCT